MVREDAFGENCGARLTLEVGERIIYSAGGSGASGSIGVSICMGPWVVTIQGVHLPLCDKSPMYCILCVGIQTASVAGHERRVPVTRHDLTGGSIIFLV